MKDWSIILVRNEVGNLYQRIYWGLIRLFTRADYNHCQLVREFNGQLYICESDVSGFRVTKTLDRWKEEQANRRRIFKVIDLPGHSEERFKRILGNKYDAKYWTYLTHKWSSMESSNCFQSLAYIFGLENYWLATANSFIHKEK